MTILKEQHESLCGFFATRAGAELWRRDDQEAHE
jgi:hypothetical protein